MITYKERQVEKIGLVIDVFLSDGSKRGDAKPRKTGTIFRQVGGWRYQVSKKNFGPILPTIEAVKKSLEGDDE